MKKIIALLLVLSMMISLFTIVTSAKREVNLVSSVDYGCIYDAMFLCNDWGGVEIVTGDYEMSIRMYSSKWDDPSQMMYSSGSYLSTPYADFSNDVIGVSNQSFKYDFLAETWYDLKWVCIGDTTDIYVNEELVGSIDERTNCMLYWGGIYNTVITDIKVIQDSEIVYHVDFSDYEDASSKLVHVMDFPENIIEISGTEEYKNENVTYRSKGMAYCGGGAFLGLNYEAPYYSDDYTFKIVLKNSVADYGQMGELVGYLNGSPAINMKNDSISWIGSPETITFDFQDETWYTIEYVVHGVTDIYVNGEFIATVNEAMDAIFYGSAYNCYIDEIEYSDADTVAFREDFEGDVNPLISATVTYDEEVVNRYDLGRYYWAFPAGNSYNPIAVNQSGNFNVEMDIRIDDAAGKLTGWSGLAVGPYVAVGGIGIDGADFVADIKVNEWYHVAFINNANGTTDIYLDDLLLGTVDKTITTYYGDNSAFWIWDKISIDNLKVGSYFNDMEDGGIGGQGLQVEYWWHIDCPNLFDYVDISEPAGGEALLIESSWDPAAESGYMEFPMPTDQFKNNYIITYDIAYAQTKESAQGAYLEYWTNWNSGTPSRWSVGTVSGGKDADQILFDWGEPTLDNFHEVTMEFDTMDADIYVDGELLYEGKIGLHNTDCSLSLFCMWYGNAIIDNFQMIDGETLEVVYDQSDLPTGTGNNRGSGEMRIVNLDTYDFCAENGCTTGETVMEYDSTCVSTGLYTTYCAVCGNVKETHEIPMKEHNWLGYDINRQTEDGLVFTLCKNGGHCTERRYVELPAADTYAGHIYQYHDFQDDFMNVMEGGWGSDNNWVLEDGTFSSQNCVSNYNYHDLPGYVNSNDFSVSWDMAIQGVYEDWESSVEAAYAPEVYAWIGGASGFAFQIGYNVLDEYIFIRPTNEGAFTPIIADYNMVNGEVYNFSVNFKLNIPEDGGAPSGRLSVFVNGKEVIYTTSRSIVAQQFAKSYTSNEHLSFVILRNFHTDMNIDNYTIASSDFRWTDRYEIDVFPGDVTGDYMLDADDVLLLRKYIVNVIDKNDLRIYNADMNSDERVDSKDIYLLRKAIAQ